ncbi:TonB-dependent siderophore receptor [Sphingomonas sp. TDK1]|uniref:TonB-dependent siderophore receptor n=1 Tax=Sphingomonas sp. TDK1 TaxID=453247 RepID=UPI0007D95A61|nr:TonB-dependent siderophore receptor [Sphingomonas sp. TDK1]OAN66634.1 TonB-dependent receptor [Sphingomonas sp. TDK1]
MHLSLRTALLTTALFALPGTALAGPDGTADGDDQQNQIVVNGTVTQPSQSATGLSLTPRETPQSITIIDQARIQDFQLTNINDVLDQTVGINVERVESDRTYYNSRGFDITNFQVDGIGLPMPYGIQYGDLDTALFDRVEAIRGANALMTGVGNPSATINYVRKRPTDTLQATATAQAGSWNRWRGEADVSVPVTDTLAVRGIYAHEQRDSHLDYNHVNRNVYGLIAAWKVTPQLTATVGYSRQENDADGVLWGALPLVYTDGSRIPYARSDTTSAPWTFWNTTDQRAFGELAYDLGRGWQAKGVFTYINNKQQARLLYAFGTPDKATGLGITGQVGAYPAETDQYIGDFTASGPLHLFGREHQLAFGVSSGRADNRQWQGKGNKFVAYPAVPNLAASVIADPGTAPITLEANSRTDVTRVYGAAHLSVTDQLKAVVGASATWLKASGVSYGANLYRKNSDVSPYAGLTYDLTPNISFYASYTSIFNPQDESDVRGRRLDPITGTSIEGGLKSEWFGGRLYATASLFRAKQKNLATVAGQFGPGDPGQLGANYYRGLNTTARGFEIELGGRVTDRWTISGGYTGLEIEDDAGKAARVFVPTKSLKLATTYAAPELRDLKLGAQLRWQNTIRSPDFTVTQKDYAVLDLMASIRLVDHVRAAINVRNVTDSSYLGSLMWGQAYYAAPRSVLGSLTFTY